MCTASYRWKESLELLQEHMVPLRNDSPRWSPNDPSNISVKKRCSSVWGAHSEHPTDPVNCRYWKEGQPDNWADNEDCGQVLGANDGRWNDETCSTRRQYICKRSNRTYNVLIDSIYDPCVSACVCVWHIFLCLSLANPAPVCDSANGWQTFGSNCYKRRASVRKSWAAARSDCVREGGDLVSITSSEEEEYVMSRLDASAFDLWIGFSTIVRIITGFNTHHAPQWNLLNHFWSTNDSKEQGQLFSIYFLKSK